MTEPLFPFFDRLVLRIARTLPTWAVTYQNAPDTLERSTRHYMARGIILVDGNNSEGTIFGSPAVNHAFRAWHDWNHIALQAPFDRKGEYRVMCAQQRDVYAAGGSRASNFLAYRVLDCEVMGQFDYQAKHGQFPVDQRAFTVDYFNKRDWSLTP